MTRLARPVLLLVVPFAALLGATCVSSDPAASREALASRPTLGAAAGFAVLANAAVTCTDGSISGNVGTFQAVPTGSVTQTICPVTGAVDVGGSASIAAYNDFLLAYDALAARACDSFLTGTLAGVTLRPGVYCFDAAAALTGTLTLDGPSTATWLFKIGTSGTGALTGTSFSVVMAGGGDPCNVTWLVAEAVTMTDSNFLGTILAGAAITMTRGTFDGRAFSKADVTITGTAVIGCEGGSIGGGGRPRPRCNQGIGNGSEGCDPGNSNHHNESNDERGDDHRGRGERGERDDHRGRGHNDRGERHGRD